MRNLSLLVAFILIFNSALRAADAPKTGYQTLTFKERSPLSAMDKLGAKLGFPEQMRVDYKIEEEKFTVYVPKNYKADGSFGVIVYMDQGNEGHPFEGWATVYDKHKLIFISAKGTVGENKFMMSLGMALDAAHNIAKEYKIDPSRVYINGLAGTMGASMLAVHYPETYTGGGFYILGSRFYKEGKGVAREFPEPDAKELDLAKKERVFLFMVGSDSTDLGPRDKAVYQMYRDEGFKAVDMIEIPGAGNIIPPAEWYGKGIARLEEMHAQLKGGKAVVATNGADATVVVQDDNGNPMAAGGAAAQKGAFKATFDKRSKESEPKALARVFNLPARSREDYDISKESFHVYVPEDYEPGVPHGLMVALSSEVGDDGAAPDVYHATLKKLKMIWVGAAGANPEATDQRRLGLPLDAVENIKARYTIDEERIYVTGVGRGGISAGKLGLHYPQIFAGGVYFQGAAYYRDLTEGNVRYLAAFPPPTGGELRMARQKSRFVFVVGAAGNIKDVVAIVHKKGYQAEKYAFAEYVAIENMGDTYPGPAAFEKGVKTADKPLAATDKLLWAAGLKHERGRHFDEAFDAFARVWTRTETDKLRDDAERKLDAIRKSRDEQLEAAKKAMDAGNKALAKTTLDKLVKEFGNLAGPEAKAMLAEVGPVTRTPGTPGTGTRPTPGPGATPKQPPEKDAATQEREATALLQSAKKAIDEGDFDNAKNKLTQIVEDYAKTKLVQQAKDLLKAIE